MAQAQAKAKLKRKVARPEAIKTARRNFSVTQDANGKPMVQLATRVEKDLYQELKLYAVTNSESISNLVGIAITELLKQRGWKMRKAS